MESSDLKNFQRYLDVNEDEKRHFVNNEVVSDSDEESDTIKIVHPKKYKKKNGVDIMLMEQLISQQNAYLKAQKEIYKLHTEIDTEEIKTRYLKLDLNNTQVNVELLTKQRDESSQKYLKIVIFNLSIAFLMVSILISRIF